MQNAELLIVLQWGRSKNVDLSEFRVHGGWPQGLTTAITENPPNVKFNPESDLDDELRADLEIYWPDLECYNNVGVYKAFWVREWRKHGRYSGMSPAHYFRGVVEVLKSLPRALGLELGTSKTVKEIRESIHNLIGVNVEVNGMWRHDRVRIIKEIRIHVDGEFKYKDAHEEFSGAIRKLKDSVLLPNS